MCGKINQRVCEYPTDLQHVISNRNSFYRKYKLKCIKYVNLQYFYLLFYCFMLLLRTCDSTELAESWVHHSQTPASVQEKFKHFVESSGGDYGRFQFAGNLLTSNEHRSLYSPEINTQPSSIDTGTLLPRKIAPVTIFPATLYRKIITITKPNSDNTEFFSHQENVPAPVSQAYRYSKLRTKHVKNDESAVIPKLDHVPSSFYIDIFDSSIPTASPYRSLLKSNVRAEYTQIQPYVNTKVSQKQQNYMKNYLSSTFQPLSDQSLNLKFLENTQKSPNKTEDSITDISRRYLAPTSFVISKTAGFSPRKSANNHRLNNARSPVLTNGHQDRLNNARSPLLTNGHKDMSRRRRPFRRRPKGVFRERPNPPAAVPVTFTDPNNHLPTSPVGYSISNSNNENIYSSDVHSGTTQEQFDEPYLQDPPQDIVDVDIFSHGKLNTNFVVHIFNVKIIFN